MKCEVEFLPVGEGERAGDCIVVRYGEEHAYQLMVVDGGTLEAGENLVAHIRKEFPGSNVIEHVVLTHADADHASGLRKLFGEFEIKNLWMHVPWLAAADAKELFADKNMSAEKLAQVLRKEYDILAELWDLAVQHGTAIRQPFQGAQIGPFAVLSPNQYAYTHLLPQFERTPEADQSVLMDAQMWIGKAQKKSLLAKLLETVRWTFESHNHETLRDGEMTSASNESSVVLYANQVDTGPILLTGDAGINALNWACDEADSRGFALQKFAMVQIPHHGSRHNVGPTILNRLLGPITQEGAKKFFAAFASAPKDDAKHPRKIVLNAFDRRGGSVLATQGENKVHWGGFSPRANYIAATPMPFSSQVEEYD